MRHNGIRGAILLAILIGCAAIPSDPPPDVRADLAPTGKLRMGLYTGNPLSVVQDAGPQKMRGVGFELGKELARRLEVPFEPVIYPSFAALFNDVKSEKWDVSLFVVNPGRTKDVDFTSPLIEIELSYLASPGSRVSQIADADRPGVRIAVAEKGQADVILSKLLKQATLIRAAGLAAGLELLKSGKADAFAANKPILFELADQLPGSRIVAGRFSAENLAMAVPKGRAAGAAYLRAFVEEAKSRGLVQSAIEGAGARGAAVAPRE